MSAQPAEHAPAPPAARPRPRLVYSAPTARRTATGMRSRSKPPEGWMPTLADLLARRPDLAGIGLAPALEVTTA